MNRIVRLAVLSAALAVVASAAAVVATPRPVPPAGAEDCEEGTGSDDSGTTVEVECSGGDGGETDGRGGSGDGGGSGGGGLNPAAACRAYPGWEDCVAVVSLNGIPPDQICGYVTAPFQDQLHYYQPDAPEDAVLQYHVCPRDGVFYNEDTRWVPAGAAVTPPSPEEVATDIWVRVRETLLDPVLVTTPEEGQAAVVDVPTFVAVANWQGEINEGPECQLGVCVELTATPALTFDPGEPGVAVIECDPPGTRYDPDGPPAAEQAAAPGACAHAYGRRTGVATRPDAWPGAVSVEWSVSWTGGGTSGTFDPVVLSADLPRQVDEVTALVTDLGVGGR